jgi:hypothetical protein
MLYRLATLPIAPALGGLSIDEIQSRDTIERRDRIKIIYADKM